jgi:hypothetical protein
MVEDDIAELSDGHPVAEDLRGKISCCPLASCKK